jgi:hypothetical protein
MTARLPRYPVFIPSKARAQEPLTIKMFQKDGVPFRVVVEPQEREAYAKVVGEESVLTLPESGRGLTYSRNWIKAHATEEGHERHWQFDDDIRYMNRLHRGLRLPCTSRGAIAAAEDFSDRYENVGLTSFNSSFFITTYANGTSCQPWPPFYRNCRCYTVFLVSNTMRDAAGALINFRGRFNEDTDMSLQTIGAGHCTILLIVTPATMTSKGGQTAIYTNDGRLRMSRELERHWPGVVETTRRFSRPQHRVKHYWRRFDTPLRLKPGVVRPTEPNEYGMSLVAVAPVKSPLLRTLTLGPVRRKVAP